MKYNVVFKAAAALAAVVSLFSACKKMNSDPEVLDVTSFDDLTYFQGAFVETDENGNFVSFSLGEPLYDDDPTHLYVGVDDIEEALEFWDTCLSPGIQRTFSMANDYTYQFTDPDGKAQGSVHFAPGTGGSVAEITTNLSGLKFFDKVTFILNSAWPYNSGAGKYYVGDVRKVSLDMETDGWLGHVNRTVGFVCVREKGNGVKPYYVSISKNTYRPGEISKLLGSKWVPGEAKAKDIYKLLHKDWNLFVAAFEEAGEGALDLDQDCWFDDGFWAFVGGSYQYAINLISGKIQNWEYYYHDPHRRVLMKIDWEDD